MVSLMLLKPFVFRSQYSAIKKNANRMKTKQVLLSFKFLNSKMLMNSFHFIQLFFIFMMFITFEAIQP